MSYEHCDKHDVDATNGCSRCLQEEQAACKHVKVSCNECDLSFCLDDVIAILRNYGVDLACGACAEIGFTGITTNVHTCAGQENTSSRKPIVDMSKEELLADLPLMAKDCKPDVLNDDQLIRFIEYIRRNCGRHDPIVYEGALIDTWLPELLRRITGKGGA